jgi:glycosyltransferase involved in cell wall biosynthesis
MALTLRTEDMDASQRREKMTPAPDTKTVRVSAVIPVFNDSERALNAVTHLSRQRLPPGGSLEIIVVDDGSTNAACAHLQRSLPVDVRLLKLPSNHGRSAARQAGIEVASGDFLLALDCDCEPSDDHFLSRHLSAMTSHTVATVGPTVGFDGGFWDRYQRAASRRRQRMFDDGIRYTGSTSNMVVRLDALRSAGGFDLRYRNYGFEDRDLLIRLIAFGEIRWCNQAIVRHLDRLTMTSVFEKMRAAGRETSRLFATQHPSEYHALGYASIDAHERALLRWPALIVDRFLRPASRAFDMLERRRLLPWPLAFAAARLISAGSFMAGTARASLKVRL